MPCTFEGLVPIFVFYLQGFSSSFIIPSSLSLNLEVVSTSQQKIAAHTAIVTSVLDASSLQLSVFEATISLAMALRQQELNLLRAAYSGKVDAVQAALRVTGVNKNCRENTGYHYTAVQRAALSNESVVEILINETGVKLNLRDDLGRTLLHLSWRTCVQKLQSHAASLKMVDADWNLRDNIHQTPLLCQARFVNELIVSELLKVTLSSGEKAVDMTEQTIDGFTVLHQVVEQDPRSFPAWYLFRSPDERSKLVGILLTELDKRAGRQQVLNLVNQQDKLKRSALHYIAEEGCVVIWKKLLELEFFADDQIRAQLLVNVGDVHGFTPLHLAVRGGHEGMVEELLKVQQIDPNSSIVDPHHQLILQKYEENHRELCRPVLFSKVPTAQYSDNGLTPLHLAAMSGHTKITDLLLQRPGVPRGPPPPAHSISPLDYSIMNRHFQVAAKLLINLGWPLNADVRWRIVDTVLCLAEGPDDKTTANTLLTAAAMSIMPQDPIATLAGKPIELLITVAAMENLHKIIRHILKWRPEVEVNIKSQWPQIATYGPLSATPLHFAVLGGHVEAARALSTHLPLDANVEDSRFRTPLQIAAESGRNDIEKLLMERLEVKEFINRLYRDRQVLVDAANALLVGAALIASVTFAGWLQPPLGYTPYYEYPESLPAPPGTYESYAGVRQHAAVQAFWFFNSLSFFFAIATVLTGAIAAMPSVEFIGTAVKSVKTTLIFASIFLAISVACVLGAFASAGFAVLPPTRKYNWSMISTLAIGGLVCLICLLCFLWKLSKPGPQQGNEAPGPPQGNEPPGPPQGNEPPGPPQGNEPPGPQQANEAPGPPQGNEAPGPPQGNEAPGPQQANEPPGPQQANEPPGPQQANEPSAGQ